MTDFYQSPADKLRFEILLKSLREGSLNLAIVGEDEVALANYGRQIYDHLIDSGEENVEWWSSADSEKLVQRFNDILSELTVDEALDKSQKRSPKRYMIFPDTHAIQDFELQLLARLINGFPTSNINLVLVVNQLDPYEEKLAVFGKNLLQWILESESPPAARPPKRSSRIETLEDSPVAAPDAIADFSATFAATLASGKFPGPGEVRATSQGNGEPTLKDTNAFDPLMDAPGRGDTNAGSESESEPSKAGSFSSKLAAILIVAIVLTVSAFALIYKDEVAKEAQNLQDFVSGKRPATAKTTPAKAVETASPANSATPAAPGQPASAPTEGTASVTPGAAPPGAANQVGTPASAVATANPTPTPTNPSAPSNAVAQAPAPTPNSVGMSSSVKVPIKTDDSLIPNKEVVIANKPVTAPVNNPVAPGATLSSNPTPASVVANAPANVIAPKADPKTQVKPEVKLDAKTETKPDTKLDVKIDFKESKPLANKEPTKEVAKEVPRETPKETPKETTKPARDQREAKPVNKPAPVAKTNDPLPKLDTKADRAEKVEESKPKSATSESASAFKPRAEDQKWVQSLPEDGWVMQHSALDSLEEARAFQQSSPFYRDAKVMYTKRKDSPPYYIVVTGPYPSRQDAEAETRKHPIMSKAWVRSARSLKNQFED